MSAISNIAHKIAHPSSSSSDAHASTMSSTHAPLAGKVAVITGASRGIGASTAERLASLGAKVVINYASSSAPADALVQKLGGHDRAIAIKADVSTVAGNEMLVAEAVKWGGKIDILICNAGMLFMRTLEDASEQDFSRIFDLNVKGPFFLVKAAVPHFKDGGRVILLSTSLNAHSMVTPDYLVYSMSKGAIEQMTRILAKDLAKKGINVNCIAPGPTATDMFLEGKSDELIKAIASRNPHNRLGKPEEIAAAMGFLAGPESSWVTGQILRVNGGFTVGN